MWILQLLSLLLSSSSPSSRLLRLQCHLVFVPVSLGKQTLFSPHWGCDQWANVEFSLNFTSYFERTNGLFHIIIKKKLVFAFSLAFNSILFLPFISMTSLSFICPGTLISLLHPSSLSALHVGHASVCVYSPTAFSQLHDFWVIVLLQSFEVNLVLTVIQMPKLWLVVRSIGSICGLRLMGAYA